uniref:NADH-ubiquinone oxidoreductase chain 4 n=1 Tax=Protaeolidiella atra TaxID=1154746 RepID=A0A7S7AAC7_9GAST|nr:NADH dehydrogenase subunit 4 [Protaeolidiella atra]QOW38677.1 NADH dehydrogenase subunit 4 [Protaeolidiella atra]
MISLSVLLLFSLLLSSTWMNSIFFLFLGLMLSLLGMHSPFSWSMDMSFNYSSMSCFMIFLSFFICFISLICSWEMKESPFFMLSILSLSLVLILAFSSSSAFFFYIFFEVSLIPTLVLIIGWGYQPERLQAGSYMMMYTVSASLPLLLVLLFHSFNVGSTDFFLMNLSGLSFSGLALLAVLGAFLVKLPMYGAHLWLPKAHVEAPLGGSMILAGILLKLGGFGIFQMKYGLNLYSDSFSLIVVSFSLWGGFLASIMCLRQVDVKSFVAYSSVGHMSIVVAGFVLDSSWGIFSALVTMVAHGFSSSAMFCLAYFSYKKSFTRNIPYIKGMLQAFPMISMWWFLFCCINMACPPTLNLLGELSVVPILWGSSISFALVMGLLIFISAAYNMYLYSSMNHGSFLSHILPGEMMKSSMMCSLMCHFIPLLIIFKCDLFTSI